MDYSKMSACELEERKDALMEALSICEDESKMDELDAEIQAIEDELDSRDPSDDWD